MAIKFLGVVAVFFALVGTARADDRDRDRAARVALALACSPAPKAGCPCGDKCACADGCPACPVAKPVAAPASPAPRLVGYRQVCHNGRCVWVAVYEP